MLGVELSRQDTIKVLIKRDGDYCRFPGCTRPFDKKDIRTIDHVYPKHLAKQDGWSYEEIESLDNKQIMHRTCNARKGHVPYDAQGNLAIPAKEPKVIKVARPDLCDTCYSGRILLPGEECPDCGIGPQPTRWPTSLQRRPKDCDHSTHHCFMCVAYEPNLRVSATMRLIAGP